MITDEIDSPTKSADVKNPSVAQLIQQGQRVITIEANAVQSLAQRINTDFGLACQHIIHCIQRQGRVVVMGMGKSGHIARKIAATFASTGTPALFVHPAEASHGDMGMITKRDVVLAISNSGETDEILSLIPLIKRLGVPFITLTGNPQSTLATAGNIHLDVHVEKEACALNLAPTASTTVALAMGDALAVAVLDARGFSSEDFALSHPGGKLGRRLLLKIEDVMHTGDDIPTVSEHATVKEALIEMTRCRLGMTAVLNDAGIKTGLFTDGDLRRAFAKQINVHTTKITEVMTPGGKVIDKNQLAAEALHLMETLKINGLFVTDKDHRIIGALNMHDLLRAGVL